MSQLFPHFSTGEYNYCVACITAAAISTFLWTKICHLKHHLSNSDKNKTTLQTRLQMRQTSRKTEHEHLCSSCGHAMLAS